MPGRQDPEDDAQLLVDLLGGEAVSLSLEYLKTLTPDEHLTYVAEQGRKAGLFPPDVDLAYLQRLMQIFESNEEASQRYQPHSYRGKIILFKAGDGADNDSSEPDYGWGVYATEGVEIIQVPGNHQSMLKTPHVQVLAEQLKHYLHTT